MGDQSEFKGEAFASFWREKKKPEEVATQAPVEKLVEIDGRISSRADKDGRVQLNARVDAVVKQMVLKERARRRAQALPSANVHDIISDAIRAFLPKE